MQLKCQSHPEEPLDTICLSSQCQHRGLICFICQLQAHKEHEPTIPLKPFVNTYLQSQKTNDDFMKEVARIDQEFIETGLKLIKIRRQCLDYHLIEEAFVKFRKATIEEISNFEVIINELGVILKSDAQLLVRSLNGWIQRYSGLHQIEKEEGQKDNIYINFLQKQFQKLSMINEAINSKVEKGQFEDSQLLSLFQITKTDVRKLKLRFSEDLKGTCMTIHSPTKASMTGSGSQRMVLLQPALSSTRSIKKWKVKIDKMASWIGVGISHLDSVKGAKFDFSYTVAGHGNYLVSSNGYSWNGYKMQFNSKHETFQYKTADIIELAYDPVHNTISFKKQNNEKVHTYDVDPAQKPIHASINMTGIGDCVQIIS